MATSSVSQSLPKVFKYLHLEEYQSVAAWKARPQGNFKTGVELRRDENNTINKLVFMQQTVVTPENGSEAILIPEYLTFDRNAFSFFVFSDLSRIAHALEYDLRVNGHIDLTAGKSVEYSVNKEKVSFQTIYTRGHEQEGAQFPGARRVRGGFTMIKSDFRFFMSQTPFIYLDMMRNTTNESEDLDNALEQLTAFFDKASARFFVYRDTSDPLLGALELSHLCSASVTNLEDYMQRIRDAMSQLDLPSGHICARVFLINYTKPHQILRTVIALHLMWLLVSRHTIYENITAIRPEEVRFRFKPLDELSPEFLNEILNHYLGTALDMTTYWRYVSGDRGQEKDISNAAKGNKDLLVRVPVARTKLEGGPPKHPLVTAMDEPQTSLLRMRLLSPRKKRPFDKIVDIQSFSGEKSSRLSSGKIVKVKVSTTKSTSTLGGIPTNKVVPLPRGIRLLPPSTLPSRITSARIARSTTTAAAANFTDPTSSPAATITSVSLPVIQNCTTLRQWFPGARLTASTVKEEAEIQASGSSNALTSLMQQNVQPTCNVASQHIFTEMHEISAAATNTALIAGDGEDTNAEFIHLISPDPVHTPDPLSLACDETMNDLLAITGEQEEYDDQSENTNNLILDDSCAETCLARILNH